MSSPGDKRIVIYCLLLVAVTLAIYNPVVRNGFIDFDDSAYILKNPHVQSGLTWDAVKWSFTTFHEGNWHPLTWLSHALDCQVFHLNPVGHHYTNVLLHAANAVLLFLLLWRATGSLGSSLLVAALFAVHPVNVESVAWAAERKNVLSMFFFLVAVLAYDRYARTARRSLYLVVVFLFALGLMAKPQVVTLPFVLLLWDYWPLQRIGTGAAVNGQPAALTPRSFSCLIWEKLPLFVLAAADSVVTAIAQHRGNAVRSISEFSASARSENAVVSYVRYLGKAFWPSHLAPLYPRPEGLLPVWQVLGAATLLLLLSVWVFVFARRDRRYLVVGWFWFLGTLVPMIGVITVGDQAMADRYAYIPFIGLSVAVVWGLGELANARRIRSAARICGAMIVLITLGALSYRQIRYWHDDEILWRHTLNVTKRNYVAHNNLALAFAEQGRSEEAVVEFRAATALHKYAPDQVLTLAVYELRVGHPQQAIEECDTILRSYTDPRLLAAAWSERGQGLLELRRYDQAAEDFQNALRLSPENGMALAGSGILSLRQGQYDAAVTQFVHALAVNPSDVNFLLLAHALRRAGRVGDADSAAAQAQKISQDLNQAQTAVTQFLSLAGVKPL